MPDCVSFPAADVLILWVIVKPVNLSVRLNGNPGLLHSPLVPSVAISVTIASSRLEGLV